MGGVILTGFERTVRRRRAARMLVLAALATLATLGYTGNALADAQPAPQRQLELLRVVRQECGACHGLHLSGGLGPALTREALADKPIDSMAAAIFGGRPGTPMPPWRAFLSAAEAQWIASQLALGLPAEKGLAR